MRNIQLFFPFDNDGRNDTQYDINRSLVVVEKVITLP